MNATECENVLDANWNERKHLIEEEFDLRLEIQALLVGSDAGFQKVLERERACQAALHRNQEEYESVVAKWGAAVSSK